MDFNLQFDSEAISTVKSNTLPADGLHSYEFSASPGQVISISATSKENNATFDLLYQEENGDWLYVDNQHGIAAEQKSWNGLLPISHSGKYLIELTNYFSDVDAEYDLFVGISAVTLAEQHNMRIVSQGAADNIKLGMTLQELMEQMSGKSVTLNNNGEGDITLEVLTGNKFLMALYMDSSCISQESKINVIEAWGREFSTEEGVHPTMPLSKAMDIYGGLRDIQFSEIEAREFATFNHHPDGIFFEVYGGDFPDNENHTREVLPDAQIVALWIKERP